MSALDKNVGAEMAVVDGAQLTTAKLMVLRQAPRQAYSP